MSRKADGVAAAASVPVAAAIAAAWAAVAVVAPLLTLAVLAWLADSRSTAPATDAVRLALDAWLLSHGVPLALPEGSFGLTPMLVTAFIAWQLGRAGATTARAVAAHSWAKHLQVAAWVAVFYGTLGALIALWGRLPGVEATPWSAAATLACAAFVAAFVGAVAGTESGRELSASLPPMVGNVLRAAAFAAGGVVAVAAILTVVMLAVSLPAATDVVGGYSLGTIGTFGLLLLCAAYLPTLVLWSVAYIVGPGFAVGSDTSVSIGEVTVDAVPAFPLLAAVPSTPGNTAAQLLLALPPLAGLLAGVWFARRSGSVTARSLLLGAFAVGATSGAVLGGLAAVSHGALGAGSLADFGPQALDVAVIAAVSIGAGSVAGAAVHRWVVPWMLRLFPGPDEATAPHDRVPYEDPPLR